MTEPARTIRFEPRINLRRARTRRGWSESEVAKKLSQLGIEHEVEEELGVDARTVSRWELGKARPNQTYIALLSLLYESPPEQLDLPRLVLPVATPKDPVQVPTVGAVFAQSAPGAKIAQTLAGLSLDPDDLPDLEDIQAAVVRLRRSYSTTAPSELKMRIDERLRQIRFLLTRNMRPSWHNDLTEAATWLVLLRGTVLADLRNFESAQSAVRAAREMAHEIGHRELEAWTWETDAWMATTDGRHLDARDMASVGIDLAPSGSHGLVAVTLQRARINATVGDEAASLSDILAGEHAMAAAPELTNPDDHYQIDPAKAAFFVSGAMAALRRPKETIEHAAEVIRVSEDKRTRNYWPMRVANARVEWAMALADLGQEDEAIAQSRLALDPEWFRPDTERRIMSLLGRLRDPRIRADMFGELSERLRTIRI